MVLSWMILEDEIFFDAVCWFFPGWQSWRNGGTKWGEFLWAFDHFWSRWYYTMFVLLLVRNMVFCHRYFSNNLIIFEISLIEWISFFGCIYWFLFLKLNCRCYDAWFLNVRTTVYFSVLIACVENPCRVFFSLKSLYLWF